MNNEIKVNIRFWLRKSKSEAISVHTIMCRITVAGIRVNFSTNTKIESKLWNFKKQKVMGTGEQARTTNLTAIPNLDFILF